MMKSILDNDLYKLTMQQAVCQNYPRAWAKYEFVNRGGTKFPEGFSKALYSAISEMTTMSLSKEEKEWLQNTCPFLTPVYLDFLRGYHFDPAEVQVSNEEGNLRVKIIGPWYRTILWEVPLMAAISELYFRLTGQKGNDSLWRHNHNMEKAAELEGMNAKFADFGTRRRYSFENHDRVVEEMKRYAPKGFIGSSNVYLAKKHGVKPIGTMAHEWIMAHAAMYGFEEANRAAMEQWLNIYGGSLGIALTDTFTTLVFLESFGPKLARLFDGVRQDSGEPLNFIDMMERHYKALGIPLNSKTLIFSDALNVDRVRTILKYCDRKGAKASFGIGTNLTNDVGVEPLNIVIKMFSFMPQWRDWTPTIKLSDDRGKHTGDEKMLQLCQETLNLA